MEKSSDKKRAKLAQKEKVSKENYRKLQNQMTLKLFDLFLTNILFHMIFSFDFIQIYSELYHVL
jgi:hypothetical protein